MGYFQVIFSVFRRKPELRRDLEESTGSCSGEPGQGLDRAELYGGPSDMGAAVDTDR